MSVIIDCICAKGGVYCKTIWLTKKTIIANK